MKRTPLKRRARLRARSAKKTQRQAIQAKVRRDVFARDGYVCRVVSLVPHVECDSGLHPHHRWLSSQGGPDAVWNEITTCPAHHNWVHANPAEARELGLYSASGEEPAFKRLTEQLEGHKQ